MENAAVVKIVVAMVEAEADCSPDSSAAANAAVAVVIAGCFHREDADCWDQKEELGMAAVVVKVADKAAGAVG